MRDLTCQNPPSLLSTSPQGSYLCPLVSPLKTTFQRVRPSTKTRVHLPTLSLTIPTGLLTNQPKTSCLTSRDFSIGDETERIHSLFIVAPTCVRDIAWSCDLYIRAGWVGIVKSYRQPIIFSFSFFNLVQLCDSALSSSFCFNFIFHYYLSSNRILHLEDVLCR